jgi:hypothetical protein
MALVKLCDTAVHRQKAELIYADFWYKVMEQPPQYTVKETEKDLCTRCFYDVLEAHLKGLIKPHTYYTFKKIER